MRLDGYGRTIMSVLNGQRRHDANSAAGVSRLLNPLLLTSANNGGDYPPPSDK